ncbi:putative aminotransferase [Campylobacter hyointestinalis]|uniref:aminotransferase class V-fold PLP-dependent enzyme n=1 Tax=Campylobacter hyointestinalis TaxID=198 RepID=UPI0008F2C5D7|nr:aminotransferase class V-fold PLP-dependent enzyme [Campylobacter hyointestinalis]QKF56046.1 cysteine sulfinate desulfinase [Campylobacter hyointestinalis subsp. hyointestinalis]TXK48858.1 aminotransferase class V-fold PLP-dependent enzyme [Campylobacter hyointestinalis]SFT68780.1 Selenocysteine lyase/Cysteine desulfurase [Campylobacter hyointestinalis]SUW90825.1 putative aminotransferase [Campylobacter hyointestinalis]
MINLEKVRKNIILKDGIYYFDWTASGLGYKEIEDEILRVLMTYSNTHSECGTCARVTTNYYESARSGIKKLLELGDDFYLMPCSFGSTAAIKKFQEIMGIYIPPATRAVLGNLNIDKRKFPLVIVSPYEHHSNEISFRYGLCEVFRVPLAKDGGIHFGEMERVLKLNKGRKIIASFSAASNVTGIKTDLYNLNKMIRDYGGIIALDLSSLAAYENVNSDFFDAAFISSHKLLGGVGGSGLLAIRKELCTGDKPTFAGGGTVTYVSRKSAKFVENKEALEDAGTPGITQLVRSFLAFKLRNDIGLETIREIEKANLEYFEDNLMRIKNLICYGSKNCDRLPIFSFNIKGISPYELAKVLSDKFSVQTRAGCACAGPYGHELLGLEDDADFAQKPGFVRASLHYTQTKDDLDYLLNAIKEAIKFF